MNVFDDPDFLAWAKDVRENMVPGMMGSAMVVSLYRQDFDVKFAVELGASLMLDKPLILSVRPGVQVPDKLVRVADAILELDPSRPDLYQAALHDAMDRILKERGLI
jgi:hypothetical protein